MAKEVIKKDGTREPFDGEKIRRAIELAGKEAGLGEDRISEVVDQVSRSVIDSLASKDEVSTSEIREMVLNELDNVEPSVADAWRRYDQQRGT